MISLKATNYLLIMLIIFQSFSAVANSLDYHSIDTQHLSEVHEHQLHDNTNSKTERTLQNADLSASNDTSHNPADCHHCGHCNGSHLSFLSTSHLKSTLSINSSLNSNYLYANKSTQVSSLFRPPKAQS
jgi:hypothetical protein